MSDDTTAPMSAPEHTRPSIWSGFYKKALRERQVQLKLAFPHLFPTAPPTAASLPGTPAASPPSSPNLSLRERDRTGGLAALALNKSLNASGSFSASPQEDTAFPIRGLDERIADNMVENCIGTMGLPVGLALNFVIDGVPTVVPMAVEEPSVIAAVSGAAKTLSSGSDMGLITSSAKRNIITAQLLVTDLPDAQIQPAIQRILEKKSNIITFSNQFCLNMHKRGGGVVDLLVRTIPKQKGSESHEAAKIEFLQAHQLEKPAASVWLVVHLLIDVCDAMGANCASTVAEGTSTLLADLVKARVAVRIVTNLNPDRVSKATFRVPVAALAYKKFSGAQVAARILEAYQWAKDDLFRATTHNKGIMNGIDAVALATGQDWRAVEAACHAWAASRRDDARYSSLTRYWLEKSNDGATWLFCGELELPIIVGTKGGVLSTSPLYSYTLGMMGFPDSKRLAAILCCVGLCQNFAALRALTTEGIQRGHMHLHARNIAIAAGAPTHAISEVTQWMIEKGRIQLDAAKEYITAHHLYTHLRKKLAPAPDAAQQKPPSMFYFQESKDKPLTLNIAFQTLAEHPVYLDFTEIMQDQPVHAVLLGGKTYDWLMRTFPLIEAIQLPLAAEHGRSNDFLCKRLKVLSLILNALLRRLMIWCPEETRSFIDKIFSHTRSSGIKPRSTSSGTTGAAGTASSVATSTKKSITGSLLAPSAPRAKPAMEKRPSIMKHVHSVIQQASKYRSTALAQPPPPLVPADPRASTPSRLASGPPSPASPASPVASPATPASPIASPPMSASPSMTLLASNSGSASPPLASGSHASQQAPTVADLGWMSDPQTVPGMDWVLPDSGIFRLDIFEDELHLKTPGKDDEAEDEGLGSSNPAAPQTTPETASSEAKPTSEILRKGESTVMLQTIPTKRQILQVGFPLVLAIWQVFELWVTQYVGTTALASSLLEEQRVIVSSLVATHSDVLLEKAPLLSYDAEPSFSLSDEDLHSVFMKTFHVQSKRAQCTLFLLIDLIGLDPNVVTLPLLTSVKAAGFYLEQEATVAHDIARLARDYRAVFGPDDPTAELVSIPVTRSPQSPQLQFRRRSLNTVQKQAHVQHPGDELIALHTEGICNSVLTFALLRTHLRPRDAVRTALLRKQHADALDEHEVMPLAGVSATLPAYLDTLALDPLKAKLGREICMVLAQTHRSDVVLLNQEYLSSIAALLRHEFKITHVFQRKDAPSHPLT